jgi:hypothetical protein
VTRKWRYILIAVAVTGCAILVANWLGTNMRRMLMLTTADPDALGLVSFESMQPITLTLESDRIRDASRQSPRPSTIQRVSFRVPAAYLHIIDLKEGRSGSQLIAFELWSLTFDPIAPDVIANSRTCRIGAPCYAEPDGRLARRAQAGERKVYIHIGNSVGTQARRDRTLTSLDWHQHGKPCKITEDTELGMTVAEAPESVRPGDACGFIGNPGIRTRDGKSFPPKNFSKRRPDGTPAYLVRCHNFSSEPEEQAEIKCRLHLYFGVWPVSVLFFGIAPKDWDGLFERVQNFLAQHVVERTS